MQGRHGASIHLEIPFYRQHYDFTCGPACLMMAMKYLDHDLLPGRELEIDIWREGNLIAVWGTGRFGLAYSAAVRGFSARTVSNTGGMDYIDTCASSLSEADLEMVRDQFYERRTRCRKRGVSERIETITAKTLRRVLFSNHVPLIVTNTLCFSKEDLPHWIAVTGIDDKFLYFNDPSDARRRKRRTRLSTLQAFIGYYGAQSMVEVWRE